MRKVIRLQCFQNLVNYRKPSSLILKETYPLPPYSTVLGMIHTACGFDTFHPIKLSIQGKNKGTISDLYTRYSFSAGGKYEEGRHQICIDDGEKYGIFKGIANTELLCENRMIIHIEPSEEDFDLVYHSLLYPKRYLALGRHEDLLDVERVDIVNLRQEEFWITTNDIYIPVDLNIEMGELESVMYTLTKEYEITKQGIRRWKKNGGKIKVRYVGRGTILEEGVILDEDSDQGKVWVDDFKDEETAVVLI